MERSATMLVDLWKMWERTKRAARLGQHFTASRSQFVTQAPPVQESGSGYELDVRNVRISLGKTTMFIY